MRSSFVYHGTGKCSSETLNFYIHKELSYKPPLDFCFAERSVPNEAQATSLSPVPPSFDQAVRPAGSAGRGLPGAHRARAPPCCGCTEAGPVFQRLAEARRGLYFEIFDYILFPSSVDSTCKTDGAVTVPSCVLSASWGSPPLGP